MSTQSADFPVRDEIAVPDKTDNNKLKVGDKWKTWLRDLRADVNTSSVLLAGGAITLASKSAAVGLTPFDTAGLSSGQYRVSAFTQIITAASINSSVTVSFTFTKNTVACVVSAPAVTSNDPTRPGSWCGPISIDAGTPVSYSIAYVSNAAGAVYSTDLTLERVNA